MDEELDLSVLDAIDPEVEAHLSPPWKRILAALRKLRDHLSPRPP
ncbi:MAG: hypothetical protein V3W28_00440 [Thermoplasmata archaeon]